MENENKTPILSVTEISLSLKSCVEQVFSHIRVRGEVSGVKKAPSGHIYFSLKDKDSVLSAVAWRGRDAATINAITDGLEIICTGKLSTYPGRSNYQMIVDSAAAAGAGALLKLLNDRREKLQKEGLFDLSRKKKIPYLPEVIGVVTSPTGAVIRDIMHRLNDRFARQVILWPVLVQGDQAADQITAAIKGFNAFPKDGINVSFTQKGQDRATQLCSNAPQKGSAVFTVSVTNGTLKGGQAILSKRQNEETLNLKPSTLLSVPAPSNAHDFLEGGQTTPLTEYEFVDNPHGSGAQDSVHVVGEGILSDIQPLSHSFSGEKEGTHPQASFIHLPRPDLLIVARGGGSLEDLWPFNEENVVRAAAESDIPLISAVGHETDTTLIDYAADLRAPTPTAAAELAVPVKIELAGKISNAQTRLTEGISRYLSEKQMKIDNLSKSIPNLGDVINLFIQKLDDRSDRFQISMQNYLKNKENQFINLKNLLKSYSFEAVLERGFSLVTDSRGKIIASARIAQTLPQMKISFFDGKVDVRPVSDSSSDLPHQNRPPAVAVTQDSITSASSATKDKNTPACSLLKDSSSSVKTRRSKSKTTDSAQKGLFDDL